jgi:aryl-alcohol dehydrogenase-like predicted oxidoreductase
MQNHYNLIYREEEREMIPTLKVREITSLASMLALPATAALVSHLPHSQHFGVGSIPWSPLARGALTRPLGERTIRADNDVCVIYSAPDWRKEGSSFLSTSNIQMARRIPQRTWKSRSR